MLMRARAGDTIVEVMVAFAIFTVVAVGTSGIMNRGVAIAERSLEITLVRQQIDAQAALIRYARAAEPTVWSTILAKAKTVTALPSLSSTTCPNVAPDNSFMLSIDTSTPTGELTYYDFAASPSAFKPAAVNSRFDVAASSPEFQGIWVIPVVADDGSGSSVTAAYDMHIGTCWYASDSDKPVTLGTIVRLYDSP